MFRNFVEDFIKISRQNLSRNVDMDPFTKSCRSSCRDSFRISYRYSKNVGIPSRIAQGISWIPGRTYSDMFPRISTGFPFKIDILIVFFFSISSKKLIKPSPQVFLPEFLRKKSPGIYRNTPGNQIEKIYIK